MTKRRTFGIVLIVVASLFALWLWPNENKDNPTTLREEASPQRPAVPMFVSGGAPQEDAPPEIVIDRVTVDKLEVCRGEENFINVEARATSGSDPHLRITVPGLETAGPRMAFRLEREWADDAAPQVAVFGARDSVASASLPHVKVKDCDEPRRLMVQVQSLPNTQEEFAFVAHVIDKKVAPGEVPFVPKVYEWDFGDGTQKTTDTPRVEHSYARRPQNRRFAYFLVSVTARDAAGAGVKGSSSLELINRAFDTLEKKNVVMIFAELSPRFPVMGTDGVVRQTARLFHTYDAAVTLTRVRILDYRRGADGTERTDTYELDARQALGVDVLHPNQQVDTSQTLDTNVASDVVVRSVDIMGEAPGGRIARGTFSVMRPPPVPTPATSERVVDSRLKAEILAARRILGKPYVTDGDLHRLRSEGRFNDIDVPSGDEEQPPSRQEPPPKRHDPVRVGG